MTTRRPVMTHGSLFSGYGGLDMAVAAAFGARTVWTSDIDKGACKVLAHRYPDVPNLGDITTIDWADVEPVDIITGGSPCQDLSTAGARAGMTDGTRSNLWVAMREAIAHVQPTYVVWENVRGAYSAHAASAMESDPRLLGDHPSGVPALRALGRVLGDLSDLGFDAEWRGVRASDVGACHQRFRVFVLAWRRDAVPDDTRGVRGHEAVEHDGRGAPTGYWAGVPHQPDRHADGAGPDGVLTLLPTPAASVANDGEGTETWLARRERVKLTAQNGNGMGMPLTIAVQLLPTPVAQPSGGTPEDHLRKKPGRKVVTDLAIIAENGLFSSGGRLLPAPRVTQAGYADDGRGGKSLDVEARKGQWGDYAAAIARHEELVGRPAPSPTEPGRNGKPRLSPEFTSWMMGLPDGWITDTPGVTRNEALKLCGNGVVPQQAEAAIRHMLTAIERTAA